MIDKHTPDSLSGCSDKVLLDAKRACTFWRIGLLVKPICSWAGIILQGITCFNLYRARQTLRTPILVWLLILVWPAWALLEIGRGTVSMLIMPRTNPLQRISMMLVMGILSSVIQLMAAFFVRAGIFRAWAGFTDNSELRRCIGNWERSFLFLQFPAAMVYIWIITLWFAEGWQIEDFSGLSWNSIKISDLSVMSLPLLMGGLGWLISLIYEFKVLSRFEKHLWTPLLELRKKKLSTKADGSTGLPISGVKIAAK